MPLPVLGELPQLSELRLAWRRFVDPRPVLIAVDNTRLVCCWSQGDRWRQRVAMWPDGVCRDGVPLNREAVGDFIADLILDCDLPGAELVLCLPLNAAAWFVVDADGLSSDELTGLLSSSLQSVDLPFDVDQSYITSSPVQDAMAIVGVSRSLIDSWSEVAEIADLPLRRVDWSLTTAQRSLHQFTQAWHGDVAWIVVEGSSIRLVLLRQQIPEVDHVLPKGDLPACQQEIRECVSAWQARVDQPPALGWWFSAKPEQLDDWLGLIDGSAGECCLNQPLPVLAESWDEGVAEVLSPLQHLALMTLQKEER